MREVVPTAVQAETQPQFRFTQPPSKVLHIRNLPWDCTEEELQDLCKPFGRILNTKLNVGANHNQAFVEFAELNHAISMVSYYAAASERATVRGKEVYLQYSTRQEITSMGKTPAGGGDGGSNVLLVTIEGVDSKDLTIEVLHVVFSAFGFVQKIATFEKNAGYQALVQYGDVDTATSAKSALDGHSIPSYLLPEHVTVCNLRISYSAHNDLNVKFQSHRSRDYTNPYLPVATTTADGTTTVPQKKENESNVLLASIDNMQYAVTIDVLHTVFSAFGAVQKIAIFEKSAGFQALIQYPDVATAGAAKTALEGHCIYDGGYCKLRLSFSRHTDLNVKANNEKSRDYTKPELPAVPTLPPPTAATAMASSAPGLLGQPGIVAGGAGVLPSPGAAILQAQGTPGGGVVIQQSPGVGYWAPQPAGMQHGAVMAFPGQPAGVPPPGAQYIVVQAPPAGQAVPQAQQQFQQQQPQQPPQQQQQQQALQQPQPQPQQQVQQQQQQPQQEHQQQPAPQSSSQQPAQQQQLTQQQFPQQPQQQPQQPLQQQPQQLPSAPWPSHQAPPAQQAPYGGTTPPPGPYGAPGFQGAPLGAPQGAPGYALPPPPGPYGGQLPPAPHFQAPGPYQMPPPYGPSAYGPPQHVPPPPQPGAFYGQGPTPPGGPVQGYGSPQRMPPSGGPRSGPGRGPPPPHGRPAFQPPYAPRGPPGPPYGGSRPGFPGAEGAPGDGPPAMPGGFSPYPPGPGAPQGPGYGQAPQGYGY